MSQSTMSSSKRVPLIKGKRFLDQFNLGKDLKNASHLSQSSKTVHLNAFKDTMKRLYLKTDISYATEGIEILSARVTDNSEYLVTFIRGFAVCETYKDMCEHTWINDEYCSYEDMLLHIVDRAKQAKEQSNKKYMLIGFRTVKAPKYKDNLKIYRCVKGQGKVLESIELHTTLHCLLLTLCDYVRRRTILFNIDSNKYSPYSRMIIYAYISFVCRCI